MSPSVSKTVCLAKVSVQRAGKCVLTQPLHSLTLCPNVNDGQLIAAQATTRPCVIDLFIGLDRKTKSLLYLST